MHIALLCEYSTLNGGERSLLSVLDHYRLTSTLASPEFTAICPAQGLLAEEFRQRNIRVIPLRLFDSNGGRLPRETTCDWLANEIRSLAPDVVHANSLAMGRLLGSAAAHMNVPTTAHLRDIIKLSKAAIRDLNCNETLIAVSHATAEFHTRQGMLNERIKVIHNGVDAELFQPRERSGMLRKELQLPADAFVILNVGQLGLRKGQDILIDALLNRGSVNSVSEEFPQLHLVLAGKRMSTKAESIAFEESLSEKFRAAGFADRIHKLGFRHDMPQLMNDADLLVHSAHQEPFGRVLLESAACGLPIIATDVGGTREMLRETAILIPPGDVERLTDVLRNCLQDQSQLKANAQRARQRVVREFTIQKSATALWEAWDAVR